MLADPNGLLEDAERYGPIGCVGLQAHADSERAAIDIDLGVGEDRHALDGFQFVVLVTGRDRDNHLRTNDFFDAPNHRRSPFKSTGIEAKGSSDFVVRGDLTIRGVTKPVALEVGYLGTSKNPYGKSSPISLFLGRIGSVRWLPCVSPFSSPRYRSRA